MKACQNGMFDRRKEYFFRRGYRLYSMQASSFISGIQMDTNTYDHGPKGKMIFATNHKMLQGIPWDTGMETQVAVILDVNGTAITARGAGIHPATFQGTAVFMGIYARIISPWDHFMPSLADSASLYS